MAKYSFEFKKEIVNEYLADKGGSKYLAHKYNVLSHSNVEMWIKNHKIYGDEGLIRSRKNEQYTFEFKLHVVALYLSTEVSYQELALSVGMNNPPLISRWVNDFQIAGPDALRPKKKGREKALELSKNVKNI